MSVSLNQEHAKRCASYQGSKHPRYRRRRRPGRAGYGVAHYYPRAVNNEQWHTDSEMQLWWSLLGTSSVGGSNMHACTIATWIPRAWTQSPDLRSNHLESYCDPSGAYAKSSGTRSERYCGISTVQYMYASLSLFEVECVPQLG